MFTRLKSLVGLCLFIGLIFTLTVSINAKEKIFDLNSVFYLNLPWYNNTVDNTLESTDINGDGFVDAIVGYKDIGIGVFLNNGDGTFGQGYIIATQDSPVALKASDIDNDSDSDLILVTDDTDSITVFLNNSDGTFAPAIKYFTGIEPSHIRRTLFSSDLNNDSYIDIVTTNPLSHTVSVLLNNGDGTFGGYLNYNIGEYPMSIVLSDVDNDSFLDLVAPNSFSDGITISFNNGDGTFTLQNSFYTGDSPTEIFAADLNGDSIDDFIVTHAISNDVSVLLNDGTGNLIIDSSYFIDAQLSDIYAADIDNDSDIDFVVANSNQYFISIFLNNGTGTFSHSEDLPLFSKQGEVRLVDIDNNNQVDILLNRYGFANQGFGNFHVQSINTFSIPGQPIRGVNNADFDKDGDFDIGLVVHDYALGTRIQLYDNDGIGNFTESIFINVDGAYNGDFHTVDMNNDTFADIIYRNNQGITIHHNDGFGNFPNELSFFIDNLNGTIYPQDIDNDGDMDIISYTGFEAVLYINNNSSFSDSTIIIPTSVTKFFFADFNNDSYVDIACNITNTINDVTIYFNNTDGSFSPTVLLSNIELKAISDVDADGDVDFLLSNSMTALNVGDGTITTPFPNNIDNSFGYLHDLNGDGYPDGSSISGNLLSVRLNNWFGVFDTTSIYLFDEFNIDHVTANDFNGDNSIDYFVAYQAKNGGEESKYSTIFNLFGNSSCCVGFRGNIDNDFNDQIDIGDLVYFVAYSFLSGPAPDCFEEADINGSTSIDISDIVMLVSFMFSGGSAPVACP